MKWPLITRRRAEQSTNPRGLPQPTPPSSTIADQSKNVETDPRRGTLSPAINVIIVCQEIKKLAFQIFFFLGTLGLCYLSFNKLGSLSDYYIKGGFLKQIAELNDWHAFLATEITLAGMTAVFLATFYALVSMTRETSLKSAYPPQIDDGEPVDAGERREKTSYLYDIISALKDLALALKGIKK